MFTFESLRTSISLVIASANAERKMVDFVARIAAHARKRNPEFIDDAIETIAGSAPCGPTRNIGPWSRIQASLLGSSTTRIYAGNMLRAFRSSRGLTPMLTGSKPANIATPSAMRPRPTTIVT